MKYLGSCHLTTGIPGFMTVQCKCLLNFDLFNQNTEIYKSPKRARKLVTSLASVGSATSIKTFCF